MEAALATEGRERPLREDEALDLPRIASMLLSAAADPRPFDPYRLDARDPEMVRALLPLFERIARSYLRAEIEGDEHVRPGPVLYVANHNGGILGPDLFTTMGLLWRKLGPEAPLYAMAHDFAMRRVTPLGRVLQRMGAMRAHRENALRALRAGEAVLAYPGGDLDAYRSFAARDRIVFGPRAGFVRVARDARVPIVPIVTQGAHRSAVIVHEGAWLASALGLRSYARIERCPIALALPWGIAVGPWVPYLPLPFRVRVRVLPPVQVGANASVELVRRRIVSSMQRALDELAAR